MRQLTEVENNLPPELMAQLHDCIDHYIDAGVFPACALTVYHQGQCLINAAWGWIDPETAVIPITPDSLFDLASVTKLFTETAFLSLVSAGKVALDTPLVDVVPEFGQRGLRSIDGGQDPITWECLPTPDRFADIMVDPADVTMEMLLLHTSGLPPWRAVFDAVADQIPSAVDPISRQDRWANGIDAITKYPFVDLPGENVHYSDLGLIMLAEVVSRLSNQPLDVALHQSIFEPLGLNSLIYNPMQNGITREQIVPTEIDRRWRQRRCWGEVHDENACGLGGVSGHAGLFGSAHDITRFGKAWLEEDTCLGIDTSLMKQATTYRTGSDASYRMGYGFMLRSLNKPSAGHDFSVRSYGHTGFTGTSLWIDPEKSLVVGCLTNRVYPGREGQGILAFRPEIHTLIAQGLP